MGNIISVSFSCGIEKMLPNCWDCAAGRASYAINLPKNLATLKEVLEELKEKRNDIERKVNFAERQNLQPLDEVKGWLSRTETDIVQIEQMINDGPLEVDKLCLGVSCSRNPLSGYRFGEEVVNKIKRVRDLQSKGEFKVVAGKGPSAVVEERPSEPTQGLEETFDSVMESFTDTSVGAIGIQGMGGIGKTTLLTMLNNTLLLTAHDYGIVIWVTVSRGGEVEMIQEEIAKRLDLYDESWERKKVGDKVVNIYKALSKLRFVLLLDDVWERLDLSRVGVPIPNSKNGSKMVFTCRSGEVCRHMEPQKIIKAECLPWGAAWKLFEDKVGPVIHAHQQIQEYAEKMAKECCGLPLALVTVGRAMASKKTVQEWRHSSEVLSKCASDFSGMGDVVFPPLKFSYDALPTDRVRSCFLYCALFPGRIYKTSLIDYWVGEGFLDVGYDVSRLQDQGHDVIGCLINASLLEDQEEYVAMHDVIRDMAIWIEENHNVLARAFSGGGRASYTIELRKNLATLKVELEELKELRNDAERRVKISLRHNLQPLDQVLDWLSRTETEIVEIEQMINDGRLEVDKLCLEASCSRNPMSGYRFGEEVVNKLHRVRNLVADRDPSAVVEERPSKRRRRLLVVGEILSSVEKSVEAIGKLGIRVIGKMTKNNKKKTP